MPKIFTSQTNEESFSSKKRMISSGIQVDLKDSELSEGSMVDQF